MKNAMYEDYFKEKITMKRLAMLLILFSVAAGFTFTGRADAEEMRKTGDEQVQPSPRAQEDRETGSAKTEDTKNIVAAKVNGVAISNDAVTKLMKVLVAKTEDKEETKELREKALDSLIFQELAYQKAKADGLAVEQKTIDDAIEKIKTSYGGEHGFSAFLEQQKMTEEELRKLLERSFMLRMITEREVSAKIVVSEDDLKKEYEKEKDKFRKPEKVSVTDVVFFLKTDDADSLRKAEEVLKKIKDDEEKNPLKLVPDGTFVVRELPDVKKDTEPVLYEEAKKLKAGELSGVIMTADSLHIIKLKEYIPEIQLTFEQVKYSVEAGVRMKERGQRMQEFEAELKKGAKIEIIDANGK